jgi:peptide-methionine (R)-S-oxide reductase
MDTDETDEQLRARLTPMQYQCTQEAGTERPFTGEYWDDERAGTYRCVVCDEPLFESDTKFDAGCGWPSFWAPVGDDVVDTRADDSRGMSRVETTCRSCGAHLGHVFPDGPQPTGDRYCINSACITLEPRGGPGA